MESSDPPAQRSTSTPLRRTRLLMEIGAWAAGVAALAVWGFGAVSSETARRTAVEQFAAAAPSAPGAAFTPNQRLWSPERIKAWLDIVRDPPPPTLGVLRLQRVGLEVPIFEGTEEPALNRGAGHIADTAAPGGDGNCGIAGHRDGFFRLLERVHVGDVIQVDTRHGASSYRIERTWIVDPEDVSVLDPTPQPSVTLVTCYPFYFIGPAPRRFIVRAVRVTS